MTPRLFSKTPFEEEALTSLNGLTFLHYQIELGFHIIVMFVTQYENCTQNSLKLEKNFCTLYYLMTQIAFSSPTVRPPLTDGK